MYFLKTLLGFVFFLFFFHLSNLLLSLFLEPENKQKDILNNSIPEGKETSELWSIEFGSRCGNV